MLIISCSRRTLRAPLVRAADERPRAAPCTEHRRASWRARARSAESAGESAARRRHPRRRRNGYWLAAAERRHRGASCARDAAAARARTRARIRAASAPRERALRASASLAMPARRAAAARGAARLRSAPRGRIRAPRHVFAVTLQSFCTNVPKYTGARHERALQDAHAPAAEAQHWTLPAEAHAQCGKVAAESCAHARAAVPSPPPVAAWPQATSTAAPSPRASRLAAVEPS